jgi:hypothetical protein
VSGEPSSNARSAYSLPPVKGKGSPKPPHSQALPHIFLGLSCGIPARAGECAQRTPCLGTSPAQSSHRAHQPRRSGRHARHSPLPHPKVAAHRTPTLERRSFIRTFSQRSNDAHQRQLPQPPRAPRPVTAFLPSRVLCALCASVVAIPSSVKFRQNHPISTSLRQPRRPHYPLPHSR